jgi:multiple sugar transport system substrate-binding protein
MDALTRRSLLRGSIGFVGAGAMARSNLANAAATTATAWWVQGFIPEEDAALRAMVADYQKASGNQIDISIVPFAAMRQKEIAAVTTGVVPDILNVGDNYFAVLSAWKDRLVDVTEIIETQKSRFSPTALRTVSAYNNVAKKRSFYMIPHRAAVIPFHIWKSFVERAGYKIAHIPKTWDAFLDFFMPVQTKLRAQGMRNVYAYGYQLTANGVDPNGLFAHFLIAYGGQDVVTADGRLHTDNPQVKAAAVRAIAKLTTPYRQGFVPPAVTNWNDADDNNAFHAKLIVMDFDGTISTEVALYRNKEEYDDVLTLGLPLSNAGKELPSIAGAATVVIPKGAKNIPVAKEFLKYSIEPKVLATYLKGGLGRFLPTMPAIAKDDPGFWLDPKNEPLAAYTRQGILGPTIPPYEVLNPAMAEVWTEHVFSVAMFDVVNGGMVPEQAIEKAFKRVEAIFARYPIQQS